MPLKPDEQTPRTDVKMPEETRKELYGRSEKESESSPTDEERNRTHSAPAQTGHRDAGPMKGS